MLLLWPFPLQNHIHSLSINEFEFKEKKYLFKYTLSIFLATPVTLNPNFWLLPWLLHMLLANWLTYFYVSGYTTDRILNLLLLPCPTSKMDMPLVIWPFQMRSYSTDPLYEFLDMPLTFWITSAIHGITNPRGLNAPVIWAVNHSLIFIALF